MKNSNQKAKETKESQDQTSKLQLGFSKKLIEKIIIALIIIILAIFFGKVAIWEYNYYNEKEGSSREAAKNVLETEEPEEVLDETEVTEEQRAEYYVAADRPRYLTIEKLGIVNARILEMGLKSNGELDTPRNIFDVGWYNASGKPGQGGTLLIDGHNGGPNIVGVFKYINQLAQDDIIKVERGDGAVFNYKVVENREIPLSEADNYMATALTTPVPGKESITLISCIGEWSQVQGTYLSRQFTRAVLVE